MTRRSRTLPVEAPRQTGTRQRTADTRQRPGMSTLSRPLRLAAFGVIVLVVGGVALALVAGRLQGPPASDVTALQVHASMGGFDPETIAVKAGQTVRVELASMDTPLHSDGGGWHQFAIDELGIDWKVGPESSQVFEFRAPATPGTYSWYCDICCGGKENPSMQGKLTVTT
jgi:cytochrome c oxidase subunit 2